MTDSAIRAEPPRADHILLGLALRSVAVFSFAVLFALVKIVEARGVKLAETLFYRQLFSLPVLLVWMIPAGGWRAVATRKIRAHGWRMVIGMTGVACNFLVVSLMPLAEAMTLQFTVPIFATVLGALVLKEPTGWHRWAAVLAGFLGVLIVAQPGSGHYPLLGVVTGLTSAMTGAIIAVLLRQLGRTESALAIVFWFTVLSLPPLGLVYAFYAQPHDLLTWVMLFGTGVIGSAGQIAMTSSIRLAPISSIAPMDYSSVIWGALFGWLIFGAIPAVSMWLGAGIIIASGLYIVHREHRLRMPTAEGRPPPA